jgi:hypothetical protein
VVFILIYIFFIKSSPNEENLVSTSNASLPSLDNTGATGDADNPTSVVAKDFLALLLNVKNIKLNDAVFSDVAFNSLQDSSVPLIPDGNEGRPNPFAQFGSDALATPPAPTTPVPPTCTLPKVLNPSTNTCVTPLTCTVPKILDVLTNTCITPPPAP